MPVNYLKIRQYKHNKTTDADDEKYTCGQSLKTAASSKRIYSIETPKMVHLSVWLFFVLPAASS